MTAELLVLHEKHVTDIPAMLRACADRIESGDLGEPFAMAAVFVNKLGEPTVWGWGHVESELAAIGLLTLGASQITQSRVTRR